MDRLFLTQQEAKIQQHNEYTIFMRKTSSPTEVKNHDLPLVGFSHNPLNGLEKEKINYFIKLVKVMYKKN